MIHFLEESYHKLMRFLFFITERFRLQITFVLIILVFITYLSPYSHERMKQGLLWIILIHSEINQERLTQQNYLPIQSGSGFFYHAYRFASRFFLLFFMIWLFILFLAVQSKFVYPFVAVFIVASALRIWGDKKYRPKKPNVS